MENALVSYLREHRFVHATPERIGRIVFFFYFEVFRSELREKGSKWLKIINLRHGVP